MLSVSLISKNLELELNDSGQVAAVYQCTDGVRSGSTLLGGSGSADYFAKAIVGGDAEAPILLSLYKPVTASASSQYDSSFGVGNLFDGAVTGADIGTTNNLGLQYACNGNSGDTDPTVAMDFGSSTTFNTLVYAQRGATGDFVDSIDLWFGDSPFSATYPATIPDRPADETLTVLHVANLTEYGFHSGHTGRYVLARLNSSYASGTANPGGQELSLGYAPSSVSLYKPVTASASSQYDSSFGVGNLFDGAAINADIGTTNHLGLQYACNGNSGDTDPTVAMDFGSSTTFNTLVYAQRPGGMDNVDSIDLWFGDSPFPATYPATIPDRPADETLTVLHVANLTEYGFHSGHTGRYVLARLNSSYASGTANPGGQELSLGYAPSSVSLYKPVTASASSQYDSSFGVGNLFDGAVINADIDTTNDLGLQYACNGNSGDTNPTVAMDFGSSTTFNTLVYAQRPGGMDNVDSIDLWFGDSPFSATYPATIPGRPADETLTVLHVANLTEYAFGGGHTGRYVLARLNSSYAPGTANPGGQELRLAYSSHSTVSYNGDSNSGDLAFRFPSGRSLTVHVDQGASRDYFTFTVSALSPLPDSLKLLNFTTSLTTHISHTSGIATSDSFAIYARSFTPAGSMTVSPFSDDIAPSNHIVGAKLGLGGSDYGSNGDGIRTALANLISNEGLLTSSVGGPSALNAVINQQSYVFAFDLSHSNVADWISLARNGGIDMILISSWWASLGHYAVSSTNFPGGLDGTTGDLVYAHSLKYATDQIHAAGLKVGFHFLTAGISDYDAYVTPIPDSRLAKDYSYTLASDMTSTQTTITVGGEVSGLPTTWIYSGNGNVLQIDNELIQYSGYSYNGTNTTFTGATRGAFGTTAASHTGSGSKPVYHLKTSYYEFCADPDSTLLDEITTNLATVINTTGADMVYLDGAELALNTYGASKGKHDLVAKFDHAVRVQSSHWDAYSWTFTSVVGAYDFLFWDQKVFVDDQVAAIPYTVSSMLLPKDFGWWGILGSSSNYDALSPDTMEYFLAKAVGTGKPASYQLLSPSPINGRQDDYLAMINNWQTLSVDAAMKARLSAAGDEFHLETLPDGSMHIVQVDYASHKVDTATDGTQTWTVNNAFGSQFPTMRIKALYGVGSYDGTSQTMTGAQSDVSATAVTCHADATASLTWSTSQYRPGEGGSMLFSATNNGSSATDVWAEAARSYASPLDISGKGALGVWVYGDGKGEELTFQVFNAPGYEVAHNNHIETVDFIGWRYFELPFREPNTSRDTALYSWVANGVVDPNHVGGVNIFYNNLPVGQTANCYISLVKALPAPQITLTNPAVTIGSTTITFPTNLTSGQYIEFNSMTDCKLYDQNGFLLGSITPTGTQPLLAQFGNTVSFNATPQSGYSARANVTIASYDKQSANWDAATVGSWNFGEASGSTVNDASPYLNNGTLSANAPTRVAGQSGYGNALQFNGVDNSVTIPASNSLNQMAGSFTVQLQFKYLGDGTAGKEYWTLLNKNAGGNGYNDPFHVFVTSGSHQVAVRVSDGVTMYTLYSGVAVNDGNYHLVDLVYDDVAKTYTLYLDGTARATQTVASNWTIVRTSDPLTLGYWPAYGNYFNGIIDEVQVLSQPLNRVAAAAGSWSFEEPSGLTVNDASPYLNNGQLSGNPPTRVAGQTGYGNALQFNGVDNSATIPASDSLSWYGSFTVQLQFKYLGDGTAGKAYWTLLNKNTGGNGYNDPFHIFVTSGSHYLAVRVSDGATMYTLYSEVAVNDGNYHSVEFVYDDVAKVYTLYLDGTSRATQAVPSTWVPLRTSDPIALGYWPAYGNYFNGIIDEVSILTRPVTAVIGYGNLPPTVTVAATINNHAPFLASSTSIPLSASVSDSDGSIGKVAFYQGMTWIADGTLVNGDYIAAWTPTAAGTYAITAKATDDDGAIAISSAVNVVVSASPTNQAVDVGQTATFILEVPGTPSQTYQWQKKPLGGSWADISGATGPYYTAAATVQGDDGAQYRVVVTNSYGSTTSSVATLYVNYGLEGWWKLDSTSGTSATDASGKSHTGTLINFPTTKWGTGVINNAVVVDGTDSYISVPAPAGSALKYTGAELSLSTWVYVNTTETNGAYLISKPWNGVNDAYNYQVGFNAGSSSTTGTVFFSLQGSTPAGAYTITSSSGISTGAWHHLAATVDSSKVMTLYIDGSEVASNTHNITAWAPTDGNKALVIGSKWTYSAGSYGSSTLNGMMDNVRVYTHTLSAEAIAEQARAPIGYWKFNETSGTTAADASGNAYAGTLINGPTWTSGYTNGAVSLDGVNDYVSVPDVRALKYTGNGLTVGGWVYVNSTETTGGYLISKPWNGSGQYNYSLSLGSDDRVSFTLQLGLAGGKAITTPSALSTDAWHHVTATVDSAKVMTLYVDGIAVVSDTHSITTWTPGTDSNTAMAIGTFYPYGTGWAGDTAFSFSGKLDNVRIYDHALNADEVKTLAVDPLPMVGSGAPPTIQSVTINDGNVQRSMVNGLTVAFSDIVTVDPDAFEVLKKEGGGGLVALIMSSLVLDGRTVVTLTFSGGLTQYGSLADGKYQLTVHGDKVRNSVTLVTLDGDGDGQAGGSRVFGNRLSDAFFRLYGDSDGDRDVDNLDFARFRTTMNKTPGHAGFLSYFDFDDDGDVDNLDFARFRVQMGKTL